MKQGLVLLGLLPGPAYAPAPQPSAVVGTAGPLPRRGGADAGLNLPPTQGTTRDGAFFPGLYQYECHPDQVARATARAGFSSLRLAVNVETAHDPHALQRHKAYID